MTKPRQPGGAKASRRKFLSGAAVAAAATVAAPNVVKAQGPDQHALAEHLAGEGHLPRVRARLRQEGQRHDRRRPEDRGAARRARWCRPSACSTRSPRARSTAATACSSTTTARDRARAVGLGPGFGMDANMLLSWHKYGGGKELLEKLYASIGAERRVVPLRPDADAAARLVQEAGHQASRTSRASSSAPSASRSTCSPGMGAAVNALPGGEIVPAHGPRPARRGRVQQRLVGPRRSASPTSPRSACCRASTRTPSSSRSCSTRPSTTRCRRR